MKILGFLLIASIGFVTGQDAKTASNDRSSIVSTDMDLIQTLAENYIIKNLGSTMASGNEKAELDSVVQYVFNGGNLTTGMASDLSKCYDSLSDSYAKIIEAVNILDGGELSAQLSAIANTTGLGTSTALPSTAAFALFAVWLKANNGSPVPMGANPVNSTSKFLASLITLSCEQAFRELDGLYKDGTIPHNSSDDTVIILPVMESQPVQCTTSDGDLKYELCKGTLVDGNKTTLIANFTNTGSMPLCNLSFLITPDIASTISSSGWLPSGNLSLAPSGSISLNVTYHMTNSSSSPNIELDANTTACLPPLPDTSMVNKRGIDWKAWEAMNGTCLVGCMKYIDDLAVCPGLMTILTTKCDSCSTAIRQQYQQKCLDVGCAKESCLTSTESMETAHSSGGMSLSSQYSIALGLATMYLINRFTQ